LSNGKLILSAARIICKLLPKIRQSAKEKPPTVNCEAIGGAAGKLASRDSRLLAVDSLKDWALETKTET